MRKKYWLMGVMMSMAATLLLIAGCQKDKFATQGALRFSTDTLKFDTVFTTLGSTTRNFKVRNAQNKPIKISSIRLAGLQGTQFRINVDGISARSFKDVEILANDSIYVFVEVTIDPNSGNNPLVIYDQIEFVTNGTTQQVVLEAWGWNAHYYRATRITGSLTLPTDKPVIILSGDSFPGMEVKQGATLNINAGTKIFMGPGTLISVDGTMNCNGSLPDSIVFGGIRLEQSYQGKGGQWLGIIYGRTATLNFTHTVIDESFFGVSDEHLINVLVGRRITTSDIKTYATSATPTVKLNKCIIRNASNNVLTCFKTNLTATNCLFHSAGGQMVLCALGGSYNFTHCTMVNVNNNFVGHKNESLTFSESIVDIDQIGVGPVPLTANVVNCVVYGTLQTEFAFSPRNITGVTFQNSLLRIPIDTFALMQPNANGCIFNKNPKFRNELQHNYQPDSITSPLYGSGISTVVMDDLSNKMRKSPPDIGALEWNP